MLVIDDNKNKSSELDNVKRVRNFSSFGHKWHVLIKPLPSGSGISAEEEVERLLEPGVNDVSKVTAPFRHNRTDAHMNPEIETAHTSINQT